MALRSEYVNAGFNDVKATIPVRGVLRRNEPMARHTVWAVGGVAHAMFLPADLEDLRAFLAVHDAQTPLFWIGLGSNLLVRDGGIAGTVINTSGRLNKLHLLDTNIVRAEAGVASAKFAKFAARQGLANGAFFAGIPGTIGGALAMNAGALGGETWPLVHAVETIDCDGRIRVRGAAEFDFGYRTVSGLGDEWFVAAHLELPSGNANAAQNEIRALLRQRALTQPVGQRSCGSVFQNPEGDFAGRLIELSGLKGRRVGGAIVSSKHANFIINEGDATAADIETLIDEVRAGVAHSQGVTLSCEVRIVGASTQAGGAQ